MFNASIVNASAVASLGDFLFGSAASIDVQSKSIKSHTLALSTTAHHSSTVTLGLFACTQ